MINYGRGLDRSGFRAFDGPGYLPGTAEDIAHKAAEEERGLRHAALRAIAPYDRDGCKQSIRDAIMQVAVARLTRTTQQLFDRCCHGR